MTTRTHRRARAYRSVLVALAVLALSAGACAVERPYASVDGTDISRDEVFAYTGIDAAAESVPGDQVRSGVTDLVYDAAAVSAAERDFGIVITEEDVARRAADPPPRWVPAFQQSVTGEELPDVVIESIALRTLLVDTVGAQLFRERYGSWEDLLATSPELAVKVCIRHLVVPTEEEAEEAMGRIEAGEDFADVATEVSLDSLSPGGLFDAANCPVHVVDAGPEFTELMLALPVGELGGPVESSSGFHVIRVEERIAPTVADLEAEPLEYLQIDGPIEAFSQWFPTASAGVDVEVASEVGRWSPERFAVVAPGA